MSNLDNPNFTFKYTALDQILRELKKLSISVDHISVKIKGKKRHGSFFHKFPPGNKTSSQRRNDVSLYIPATSQVRLK